MIRNLARFTDDSSMPLAFMSKASHAFMTTPIRRAGLLIIFVVLSVGLGWWWYSAAVASSHTTDTPPATLKAAAPAPAVTEESTAPEVPADTLPASSATPVEGTADTSQNTTTQVTVNGESVPLPENGTVHKVITDDGGTTNVDISVNSQSSGTDHSRSSTRIQLDSHSDTKIDSSQ